MSKFIGNTDDFIKRHKWQGKKIVRSTGKKNSRKAWKAALAATNNLNNVKRQLMLQKVFNRYMFFLFI